VRRPVLRSSTEHGPAGTATMVAPATVAPPAPEVAEVLPAFRTRTRHTADRIDVHRSGAVVRVWLERPWLVSGDEERLAVVLAGATDAVGTALARDPGALGGAPRRVLTSRGFPAKVTTVPDADGTGDTLLVHDVRYDEDQQRWACDIELRGDLGYRPWLRLVLARWQSDAVDGQRRSPLVYCDPLRLGHEREVTVRRLGRGWSVRVAGPDHGGMPSGGRTWHNQVKVQGQVADPAVADPDLRWVDAEQPVTLTRSRPGIWTGLVTPRGDLTSGRPARLVITETEPVAAHGGSGLERTVVYVETVEVPGDWLPRAPGLPPGQPR
jgi:hypothetical protein